jgi:hypothetical protein
MLVDMGQRRTLGAGLQAKVVESSLASGETATNLARSTKSMTWARRIVPLDNICHSGLRDSSWIAIHKIALLGECIWTSLNCHCGLRGTAESRYVPLTLPVSGRMRQGCTSRCCCWTCSRHRSSVARPGPASMQISSAGRLTLLLIGATQEGNVMAFDRKNPRRPQSEMVGVLCFMKLSD